MKTYVFHTDPGHGWIAVKRSELTRLGILDKISHYSYQRGETVYLEEDCDYHTFVVAKETAGEEFTCRDSYTEHSPVRSYVNFST